MSKKKKAHSAVKLSIGVSLIGQAVVLSLSANEASADACSATYDHFVYFDKSGSMGTVWLGNTMTSIIAEYLNNFKLGNAQGESRISVVSFFNNDQGVSGTKIVPVETYIDPSFAPAAHEIVFPLNAPQAIDPTAIKAAVAAQGPANGAWEDWTDSAKLVYMQGLPTIRSDATTIHVIFSDFDLVSPSDQLNTPYMVQQLQEADPGSQFFCVYPSAKSGDIVDTMIMDQICSPENQIEFDNLVSALKKLSNQICKTQSNAPTNAPTTMGPTTRNPTTVVPTTLKPTTRKPTTVTPTTIKTLKPTTLKTLEPTTLNLTTPNPTLNNTNGTIVYKEEPNLLPLLALLGLFVACCFVRCVRKCYKKKKQPKIETSKATVKEKAEAFMKHGGDHSSMPGYAGTLASAGLIKTEQVDRVFAKTKEELAIKEANQNEKIAKLKAKGAGATRGTMFGFIPDSTYAATSAAQPDAYRRLIQDRESDKPSSKSCWDRCRRRKVNKKLKGVNKATPIKSYGVTKQRRKPLSGI